ncbi:hypothetical protein [Legionella impletisoli]|uniref:Uncharacterized protein n=1 Tax=Legionella impletisoli TaxID=343510 RepID=A0A917JUP7_9GAMM|nr:hypothetical protein [Legionella impletisoli]GGI87039.1 hypothetical protein GCM10007966_14670 [Legionella impletisoli]
MRAVDELTGLVSSKYEAIKTLLAIVKLETKLAGLSVFPLVMNVGILIAIAITSYFTAMILFGYGFYTLFQSVLIALAGVFILNLIFLGISVKYLLYTLKNMSFERTRRLLSQQEGKDQYDDEKRSTQHLKEDGKEISSRATGSDAS